MGAGFSGLAAAYELSRAGYEVTVVEARNRIGGRVISFSDLVPGKNVEGGGELIGSNHPAWVAYAKQFKLEFLDVGEEDAEFPIVLGGKRLTPEESEALWEEMEKAFNTIVGGRGESRRRRAVESPERGGVGQADAGRLDRRLERVSRSARAALRAMMTADNGVVTRVAELPRQPGDGEGRRPREVLDRIRSVSLQGGQPAARDGSCGRDRSDARDDADASALDLRR